MGILKDWIEDLPQQFQGKKFIEILISAFSRQIEEVYEVFEQLDTKTDLENAEGVNLDMIGDIVNLTRKEAGMLAGIRTTDPVIADERYRQFLKYKILKNTTDCTYYDIMKAIEILWQTEGIKYYENPDRPATIVIDLQVIDIDSSIDPAEGKILEIKSSGIGLVYTINYIMVWNNRGLEKIECNKLKLHYELPFYLVRTFDGSWILDGSCLLDAKRIFETRLKIKIKGINVLTKESIGNVNLAVLFYDKIVENIEMPNTEISVGVDEENDTECALGISLSESIIEETFDRGNIIMKRNLWYFDGTYLLDGTRFFNAEERKEDI